MRYRTLGRTGLQVSEVGLGGGGIGHVWGATTDRDAMQVVHRAVDLGITFFDVAPDYGDGKAEEVLGHALAGRRPQMIVATKVHVPADLVDGIAGHVERSLTASLRRLRTDYVDLLQLHNSISARRGVPLPTSLTARDTLAAAEAMLALRDRGVVRFIGFTAWRVHKRELQTVLDSSLFDTLQTEYNLLNMTAQTPPPPGADIVSDDQMEALASADPLALRYRRVDQGLAIPKARARGLGIIGIRPYLAGILTDALARPIEPGPMEALASLGRRLEFLRRPGDRTLSQAALRFCLMNPHLSTVVPGAKNSAEVEEAAACSGMPPLSAQETQKILEVYQRRLGAPS